MSHLYLLKGCTGGDDCCTSSNLCGVNEGDCDSHSDCQPGLFCDSNNCVGDTFEPGDDCCTTIGLKPNDTVLKCPATSTNTHQRVGKVLTPDVMSWEDCSNLCQRRFGCKYWTWHNAGAGVYAYGCVTMTDFGYSSYDTNVISGNSKCFENGIDVVKAILIVFSVSI